MDLNQIITDVMLVFFALGAVDYVLDGRFGLSKEFEQGIMAAGRLTLCMAGFIVLAPLIAQQLGPVVAPFFRTFGVDPSMIAGMLLANDCGGAALAMELADSPEAGQFSGLIVGSMLGTVVMLSIPTLMSCATREERPSVIYGILCGIITIPLGCVAGGMAAGFPVGMVVRNTMPVLVLSLILLVLLLVLGEKIVPAFSAFGRLLVAVAIFGLTCGAVESLTGYAVFEGMETLDSVFPLVGGISIYLAGAFTLLAVVRRLFAKGLSAMGQALGINNTSVSALLLALANALPPIMMIHEMDDKGRMVNVAFLASASCIFGDHLAFTSQVAPELCIPVIVGKAAGGVAAFAAALLLAPKLLKCTEREEGT